eukprot:TRINITY_DN405_c0_g3_i1.p1 TRINITY_DN405_c0_g3~~TRINITY_DN405_c0_g3_i1.p1  ORF type:complete len:368 (-),score=76.32 TRINITY_DN405_c0_g3_i1:243-1346(-)
MAASMAVRFLPPASFHHPNKLSISVQWRTQPSKTKFSYFLKPSSRAKGKKFICNAAPQNQNDDNKVQNHIDMDIRRLLNSSRTVQWYPGHIAKAEKELKQQLKLMDVIIEVRDARIPLSTGHPEMDSWIGDKKKILVLNRIDMISTAEKNAWSSYFKQKGLTVILANGKLGTGTMKLGRAAKSVAKSVNDRRRAKGLLPRAVRAGVVGYPNVGKSSLINRLLKRRICEAASRPGVTRELQWVRIGKELDLLDSPGILPMQLSDQVSAIKLAICDDIGEKSYSVTTIAAILIEILKNLPSAGTKILTNCYKIDADGCTGEVYLKTIGLHLFKGDTNQAACRVLQDFRKGKFGWIALERPPPRRKALHW